MPRYGYRWDERSEVIRCCLECPMPRCSGREDCDRRAGVIEGILAREGGRRHARGRRGIMIEIGGERRNIAGWARALGISPAAVYYGARVYGSYRAYILHKLRLDN